MMSNWIPEGSVPYDTAFADGDYAVDDVDAHGVPYFSCLAPRVPKVRNPKHCIGNQNTCKGFKSAGTDYCNGHLMSLEKSVA